MLSEAVWDEFLTAAQPLLSRHVFETWLKPVRCRSVKDGVVTLEVRDRFSHDWLSDHYLSFIRDGLSRHAGVSVAIEWVINPELRPAAPTRFIPSFQSPLPMSGRP